MRNKIIRWFGGNYISTPGCRGCQHPLYLTKLKRGGGTKAASFSISSSGLKITCVVPSRQRRFRRYSSQPSGKTDNRSAATDGRQA
jgi:hypothetical protein